MHGPYLLGSVPMEASAESGRFRQTFFILLGFTPGRSSLSLWFQPEVNQADSGRQASPVVKGLIGGAVGLLSDL